MAEGLDSGELDVIGRGRFASVHKRVVNGVEIAVKVHVCTYVFSV